MTRSPYSAVKLWQEGASGEVEQQAPAIAQKFVDCRTVGEPEVGNTATYQWVAAAEVVAYADTPHPLREIRGAIARCHQVVDYGVQGPGAWLRSHEHHLCA